MFAFDENEHSFGGSDLITNAFLNVGNHIEDILEEKDDLYKIKNELNEQKKLNEENVFTLEKEEDFLSNPVSEKTIPSR